MKNQYIEDILRAYTEGKTDITETNVALKNAGFSILDPHKNDLTPDEIMNSFVGEKASEANGFGLLETGTGSYDKVEIKNGELANMDCGEMLAFVHIMGKRYKVEGKKLVD